MRQQLRFKDYFTPPDETRRMYRCAPFVAAG
jgi:hypothetical protein